MPEPRLTLLRPEDPTYIRITLERYGKEIKEAHKRGGTKGQQHLIYYLDMILQGYLTPDALQQNDLDQATWTKLQGILKKIGGQDGRT